MGKVRSAKRSSAGAHSYVDVNTIRKLIAEELSKSNPDWSLIENASRGQVDSDPNTVRFHRR